MFSTKYSQVRLMIYDSDYLFLYLYLFYTLCVRSVDVIQKLF